MDLVTTINLKRHSIFAWNSVLTPKIVESFHGLKSVHVDSFVFEGMNPQHQQHFESSFMNGVALFKTHELNSLTVNLHENLDIFLQ